MDEKDEDILFPDNSEGGVKEKKEEKDEKGSNDNNASQPKPGQKRTHKAHRDGMAFLLASLRTSGGGVDGNNEHDTTALGTAENRSEDIVIGPENPVLSSSAEEKAAESSHQSANNEPVDMFSSSSAFLDSLYTPYNEDENEHQSSTGNNKSRKKKKKKQWKEKTGQPAPKRHVPFLREYTNEIDVRLGGDLPSTKIIIQSIEQPIRPKAKSVREGNNFVRGCKWSPDGHRLLTVSDDRHLRVYGLNRSVDNFSLSPTPVSYAREGDLIYDFCWHPTRPDLFASTSRQQPIHVRQVSEWNGENHSSPMLLAPTTASYRPINHLDELAAAQSICFSADGRKLISGFSKKLRIFDVDKPGREFVEISTKVKHVGGQSGLISCLTYSPEDNGSYAAGSYAKSVALYALNAKSMICCWEAHRGGLTHMKFSSDGTTLYTAARKDCFIHRWDVRMPGFVVSSYKRPVSTNQRVYFDISRNGEYLVSGGDGGLVHVWDLNAVPERNDDVTIPPLTQFFNNDSGHEAAGGNDLSDRRWNPSTVSSISLNEEFALMATGSGQRVFPCPLLMGNERNQHKGRRMNQPSDGESSGSEKDEKEYSTTTNNNNNPQGQNGYEMTVEDRSKLDNSVRLWRIGSEWIDYYAAVRPCLYDLIDSIC